jgi:1-deoxy-D-xylulose-5-phosphate reductoisomerase
MTMADDRKTVSIVGSTGSIGTQTLDVVAANPERFRVVALGAFRSVDALAEQANAFHPAVVAIADETKAAELQLRVPSGVEVRAGNEALASIAVDADVVMNAVVGFAGLPVTMHALQSGKRLALANKESLIAAGPLVQTVRHTLGAELLPVDSEHGALHQCLRSGADKEVRKLLITASGGPFRGKTFAQLQDVTVEEALAHPTWKMGPKITIDSSTLFNKGLEVIEAHEFFGIDYDDIEVSVHPESIVHSAVEYTDGSTIAQLSNPDMRLPIGYALGYPNRLATPYGSLDWTALGTLTFEPPDRETFRCLDLAYAAGRAGGTMPTWLNAANEIAVAAFLGSQVTWTQISSIIEKTLEAHDGGAATSVEAVIDADRVAREIARRFIES